MRQHGDVSRGIAYGRIARPAAADLGSRRGREGKGQARAIVVRVSRRAGSPSLRMSLVRRAFISKSGRYGRVHNAGGDVQFGVDQPNGPDRVRRLRLILFRVGHQLQHAYAACRSVSMRASTKTGDETSRHVGGVHPGQTSWRSLGSSRSRSQSPRNQRNGVQSGPQRRRG